jgi:inosine-uridine nucleoside N-ribohydrolase
MKTNITTNNKRIAVWLDCDPGIDDLFALLLCCESPLINLKGVSCSTGNSNSRNTSLNVLKILNKIKRMDIAVI